LCLSGKVNNVECLFFYLHGEAIKFDKDWKSISAE
jgi:hypothetical protein